MTPDEFIALARARHGEIYDYSQVEIQTRRDKVVIVCATHGPFLQQAGNHINGQGCPPCAALRNAKASASRAVGRETFIERARRAHGERYSYDAVIYKDQNTPVEILCPVHGIFRQTPKIHSGGHGCPQCAIAQGALLRKSEPSAQIAKYQAKYPDLDFAQSIYQGCHIPMTAVCPQHGPITKTPTHWNVNGCPDCGRESSRAAPKKTTHLQVINQARSKDSRIQFLEFAVANSDRFDFSKAVYTGIDDLITVICKKHDLEYQATPKNLYKSGGCRRCGAEIVSEKKRLSQNEVLTRFREVHGDKYDYSKVAYDGKDKRVTILCRKHGEFEQIVSNHFNGMGCPSCGNQASRHEESMLAWLEELGIEVQRRNRKLIAPKEIDLWIPEKRIGIEIHGLYWHREEQVGNLHRIKWEMAQAKNIRLIQVFEDEWLNQRTIIENRLLAVLGLVSRIGARQCELREINATEAGQFLAATHLQGRAPSSASLHLGLFHRDELVAVASFGPSRGGAMNAKRESNQWEVLRYASNGSVTGGFGRLLQAFIRAQQPARIVSYCDLRFGTGDLYRRNGFFLDSISQPDYWWIRANGGFERISRYAVQKHKLKNHPELSACFAPDKTEREICEAAGWKKILGVGHQKWVLSPR